MIATAPQIPFNLKQKLIAAVRPFQREYDDMTLRDARRLLGRHGFKMPVLYSLVFHDNGNLQRVNIRENATLRPARLPSQIASDLTIFSSPERGADDLWSSCLHRIVEDAAKQCIKDGRHRAATLSDAEIESILRRIPDYESCRRFDLRERRDNSETCGPVGTGDFLLFRAAMAEVLPRGRHHRTLSDGPPHPEIESARETDQFRGHPGRNRSGCSSWPGQV